MCSISCLFQRRPGSVSCSWRWSPSPLPGWRQQYWASSCSWWIQAGGTSLSSSIQYQSYWATGLLLRKEMMMVTDDNTLEKLCWCCSQCACCSVGSCSLWLWYSSTIKWEEQQLAVQRIINSINSNYLVNKNSKLTQWTTLISDNKYCLNCIFANILERNVFVTIIFKHRTSISFVSCRFFLLFSSQMSLIPKLLVYSTLCWPC